MEKISPHSHTRGKGFVFSGVILKRKFLDWWCWLLKKPLFIYCIYFWLHWVFAAGAGFLWLCRADVPSQGLLLLWRRGSSARGLQQLRCMGLVAPQHADSFQTRDGTHVPCIGRQMLNHWTTRECLQLYLHVWQFLTCNKAQSKCHPTNHCVGYSQGSKCSQGLSMKVTSSNKPSILSPRSCYASVDGTAFRELQHIGHSFPSSNCTARVGK